MCYRSIDLVGRGAKEMLLAKNKISGNFDKLVLDNKSYDATWIRYKVHRVLKISSKLQLLFYLLNTITLLFINLMYLMHLIHLYVARHSCVAIVA